MTSGQRITPARLAVVCSIVALTFLGFFELPGHTYLQSDTQIYVPMLEHIWDPTTYPGDLVATKPHLSYTLYDEVAIALRWLTRSSFRDVLMAQQLLFRALQILGIYLLASAAPLSRGMALLVAALSSLGATIAGPAVLTIEYEPVPRGFAIGLVMLAIGFAAREKLVPAGVAASVAFLYHAPTTLPFWIVFGLIVVKRRRYRALLPLVCAMGILLVASRFQAGVEERQAFFFRIDPEFEMLQRMRASYNWVSTWAGAMIWQYLFYWTAGLAGFWRVQPRGGRLFLLGMPLLGLLSVPVSFLFLERVKWGFIPQFQPARALLFVTLFAIILCALAGVRAAGARKPTEAALWFAIVFAIPMQPLIQDLRQPQMVLVAGLAGLMAVAVYFYKHRWAQAVLAGIVLAAYVLPPTLGRVSNYPVVADHDVDELVRWAGERTPRNAVLLFADAGKALYPGVIRARSLRPVYVDWKSGGQVNYYRSQAEEWWSRWQSMHALQSPGEPLRKMPELGIDYVVLSTVRRLPDRTPAYQNRRFVVYKVR